MKYLSEKIFRGLSCMMLAALLALLTVAPAGCQKETKKKPTPEEMQKARQQQIEMSRREMQDQRRQGP